MGIFFFFSNFYVKFQKEIQVGRFEEDRAEEINNRNYFEKKGESEREYIFY